MHRRRTNPDGTRARASLTRTVVAVSTILAASAGYTNVVLLRSEFTPVTHVTGAVSTLSADIGISETQDALRVLSLIASFIFGAVLSGFILGGESLRLGRPYGVAMLVQGLLLATGTALLARGAPLGVHAVAVSAGLQNAMASSYGGLIIRTTHVTGVATDLGFRLGAWARRREVEAWTLLHLCALLIGFFGGGVVGALAAGRWGSGALILPAGVVTLLGASYTALRMRRFSAP